MKTCRVCGKMKPPEEFEKHSQCVGGRTHRCKECVAQRVRLLPCRILPEKIRQKRKISLEWARSHPKEMSEYRKKSYWKHREKRLAEARAWAKERRKAWHMNGSVRPRGPKQSRELLLAKKRAHMETYRLRPEVVESSKKWLRENHDWTILQVEKRRAILRAVPATLTVEEWQEVKKAFDNRCAYCGRDVDKLTMDHVIPLTRGGGHVRENVAPACLSCNSSKHTRLLSEWRRARSYDTFVRRFFRVGS